MSGGELYSVIEEVCEQLYYMALTHVPSDVKEALQRAYAEEENEIGKSVLETILKNIEVAEKNNMLVCQDTGTPVFYVQVGENVDVNYKRLYESIKRGVSSSTLKYSLRPNMLEPLTRRQKGDNVGKCIPVVHLDYLDDLKDSIKIVCVPKGSGSENQSFLRMLSPSEGVRGVINFVLESVVAGAGKACAPVIVGVGVGGTFEECAWLAKKAATIRKLNEPNPDAKLRALEEKLLEAVNELGIGPMGLGGRFTALAVNIETADTHISQLPVAVNLQCWKGQRSEAVILETFKVEYRL